MKFSKREWFFTIVIISLIQGFIWYAAFVNAGNGSALNFISFAGTLVSIILAILAIGYTYGESISQKNQSDTVVNQISTLNEVIGNIQDQSENMNQIKDISRSLTAFSKAVENKFDDTQKEVETISSALARLTSNGRHKNTTSVKLTYTQKETLIESLIDTRQPISEVAILGVILTDGLKQYDLLYEGVVKYTDAASKELLENKDHDSTNSVLIGAVFSTSCLLESIGLVSYAKEDDKSHLRVEPELKTKFVEAVKANPKDAGVYYSKVRDKMLEALST
ncbi:hypothetical protein [Pseudoalteromonas rubra]|uniref:hypothetical protein n=1 Tax=Pseudoalteromonas rubra TaxID=43658 RepID=UPI000F76D6BC|nr:hypothetical protein [Pseudoalteromonas rubra]